MAENSDLQFGRVLEEGTSDKKIWFIIIPAVLALAAVLVFAGFAISKAGGLESKVRLAEQQAQESNKAVEERDKLLQKARADEGLLRSPGQGVAVMAAAQPDSPASGVAVVHPDQKAVKMFVFGLKAPEAGHEYRVQAVGADKQRAPLGTLVPDDRGTAFLLAKDLPEGASGVEVVLATAANGNGGGAKKADAAEGDAKAADAKPADAKAGEATAANAADSKAAGAEGGADAGADATLVLAGEFPKPGTAGVVQAPDLSQQQQVQARTPARNRRPLRQ